MTKSREMVQIADRSDEAPDLVAEGIVIALRRDRRIGAEGRLVADAVIIFRMRVEQAHHQRRLKALEGKLISVANQHRLFRVRRSRMRITAGEKEAHGASRRRRRVRCVLKPLRTLQVPCPPAHKLGSPLEDSGDASFRQRVAPQSGENFRPARRRVKFGPLVDGKDLKNITVRAMAGGGRGRSPACLLA